MPKLDKNITKLRKRQKTVSEAKTQTFDILYQYLGIKEGDKFLY